MISVVPVHEFYTRFVYCIERKSFNESVVFDMNEWFTEVFMRSIFERAGVGKNIWLSQKQTAVCVSNMEKHA